MNKHRVIKFIIINALVLFLISYIGLFIWNVRYTSSLFIIAAIVGINFVVYVLLNPNSKYASFFTQFQPQKPRDKEITKKKPRIATRYKVLVVALLLVIYNVGSSPIFFSHEYYSLLDVNETSFQEDFTAVSVEELPIVDINYAKQLGDKKIGEVKGLGSEFEVGEYSDILIGQRQYLVAPLEYRGFIKYFNNRSKGTPGYIMVDKVSAEVKYINNLNGEMLGLKYVESSYFNTNLTRHAYLNNNFTNILEKPFFELNDELEPYFIIPKLKPTIFINGGLDVYEIVVINAQTGEINNYSLDNKPEWIDNVYPKELLIQQIDYWGIYENGYLNSILGQENVVTTTSDSRHIQNNNELEIYTGLTSVGGDESTVGFMFVSTSTKQADYYFETGATEFAAMQSAEGKVQDLGYNATFPVTTLIDTEPTYFITLKDASGLIKMYAFVNISDFTKVSVDSDLIQARNNYVEMIGSNTTIESTTITGVVERINYVYADNQTTYYIKLENDSTIYTTTIKSDQLPLTQANDTVTLVLSGKYITSFENEELNEDI